VLSDLSEKFSKNPKYKPTSTPEHKIMDVLNKITMIPCNSPCSAGYKQSRRNEIRGLINRYRAPALFITINPADVLHPLVRLLSGHDIDLEDCSNNSKITKAEQHQLVADNPAAATRFFNIMMKKFMDVLLMNNKSGQSGIGIFDKCKAYYGMVEAQGKGTLHCHMLIWLEGHMSPRALQVRMSSDENFKTRMLEWLESIIKCQLLGAEDVIIETNGPTSRPSRLDPHPVMLSGPKLDSSTFNSEYIQYVNGLVLELNWHVHTHTCWKYLKAMDEKTDENCRMRINGEVMPHSSYDKDSHTIKVKHLHPHISNYNDILSFLLKCNNDIKFIGSGEDAKATIYYITDYVTKNDLPLHVGMSAFSYVVQTCNSSVTEHGKSNLLLINKCINILGGKIELSHQQVMNYLISSGDTYTNESYKVLWLGPSDRLIRNWYESLNQEFSRNEINEHEERTSGNDSESESDSACTPDDDTSLVIDPENETISASNQFSDYIYQSEDASFDNLSLYEFVSRTSKLTKKQENIRFQNHTTGVSNRGRPINECGSFLNKHAQSDMHLLRFRTVPLIPVILGPTIPKYDETNEKWCQLMLILFKPWRKLNNLINNDELWQDAFANSIFDKHARQYMKNIELLCECRVSRDSDRSVRYKKVSDEILHNQDFATCVFEDVRLDPKDMEESTIDNQVDLISATPANVKSDDDALMFLTTSGLSRILLNTEAYLDELINCALKVPSKVCIADMERIKKQIHTMELLKNRRRPEISLDLPEMINHDHIKQIHRSPEMYVDTLQTTNTYTLQNEHYKNEFLQK
jgi:hypothetical protein